MTINYFSKAAGGKDRWRKRERKSEREKPERSETDRFVPSVSDQSLSEPVGLCCLHSNASFSMDWLEKLMPRAF